jgi:hypothetical protein
MIARLNALASANHDFGFRPIQGGVEMNLRVLRLCAFVLALTGVSSTCLLSATPLQAADEPQLVYSAGLSLTGGCAVSTVDPVPDPGCPGGSHPPKRLRNPCGTVTDSYGNLYVASSANAISGPGDGHIDIFNAKGEFLTEIADPHQPCDLAVDSEGNLYVQERLDPLRLLLFQPPVYPPTKGAQYPAEDEALVVYAPTGGCGEVEGIAVDPSDDHLYVQVACQGLAEFGAAAEHVAEENWTPLRAAIGGTSRDTGFAGGLDVYGKNHDVYSAGVDPAAYAGDPSYSSDLPTAQRIYVIDSATGQKRCESDGSTTPAGHFSFINGNAAIAVDQSTGEFYVDDTKVNKVVDRFDAECHYLGQLPQQPQIQHPDFRPGLAIDAPCVGIAAAPCNRDGYHSPNTGNVYVGSGEDESKSHLFAFVRKNPGAPEIESQTVSDVTEVGAMLHGMVNPHTLATSYQFEYISQADYEAAGNQYGSGTVVVPIPDLDAGEGNSLVPVSQAVGGLEADTAYRFRIVAENCEAAGAIETDCVTLGEGNPGATGADAIFRTYPLESAALPDRRAYELVTPPSTGGYIPTSNEFGFTLSSTSIVTNLAAPDGNGLIFGVEGGSIPGFPGGGFHDTYEARREAVGGFGRWSTSFNGVAAAEAREPVAAGFSGDHRASFWEIRKSELAPDGAYLRRAGGVLDPACSPNPIGDLEVIGCGSLGTDPTATGEWLAPDASHVIFETTGDTKPARQLESQAAPTGTRAVYDRTSDGITHVVSLKPSGNPFNKDENSTFKGASSGGTVVAFSVGSTLYARVENEETVAISDQDPKFAGVSSDGSRVFYLVPNPAEPRLGSAEFPAEGVPQGEIFACEVRLGPCTGAGAAEPIQIGSGGKSVVVNISADGSHVYFTSPLVLDPEEQAVPGKPNLYSWDQSGVELVAPLALIDVTGREGNSNIGVGGLGFWISSVVSPRHGVWRGPASDPSRSTPDGAAVIFESQAQLTAYENAGRTEIYRFKAHSSGPDRLLCLSCNPTEMAATSHARLQSDPPSQFTSLPPVAALTPTQNLTSDGDRAFFETSERLVAGDIDGKLDVYEWRGPGAACDRPGGCVNLMSSGRSASDDYLYAIAGDGRDVFFESGDLLVPEDREATPSIYDARTDGGAPPLPLSPLECREDGCQSTSPEPPIPTPGSASFQGQRHPSSSRCPKGKRHGGGKQKPKRCVKKHKHRKHKRRTGGGTSRRAA